METAIDRIWDRLSREHERTTAAPAPHPRGVGIEADDAAMLARLFSLKAREEVRS
ncbi:hypothetical protein [Novosphingopyxis sp. YJ-S2-01]|uniref:hypothetical protein n=1 Tax=Novosphingopyxis sp. YJ-S2-01 TaxID=2794021 RepID=UPI0018DC840A|nr:hypothetical protein [Novosphingopyxis sp. YJ-S2-01]MBH9536230.1 hypothetical protein [Novosphingopyxis sp. YJ-S2-01]